MSMKNPEVFKQLHRGVVIPAHPLALTEKRELNEENQRALTRYYLASGAGGIAVGVHTTQFEIREPGIDLYEPVLKLAADEIDAAGLNRPFIKVAGICGPTSQAEKEAETALQYGYHFGLLSMGGLENYTDEELLQRAEKVSKIIPLFGFYLQPAVGGRVLSYNFWKKFTEIQNVYAIKVAAFNRYQTLDVLRAVAESDRKDEIALYTGNDDHIIHDLLTPYRFMHRGDIVEVDFVGGLLGQWAVWTSKAVEILKKIKEIKKRGIVPLEWLTTAEELTDANAAVFDSENNFKGCIPGIHEILRRQGLLKGRWCLNPDEVLSEGQSREIDRVCRNYPHLQDDEFVRKNLTSFF